MVLNAGLYRFFINVVVPSPVIYFGKVTIDLIAHSKVTSSGTSDANFKRQLGLNELDDNNQK